MISVELCTLRKTQQFHTYTKPTSKLCVINISSENVNVHVNQSTLLDVMWNELGSNRVPVCKKPVFSALIDCLDLRFIMHFSGTSAIMREPASISK